MSTKLYRITVILEKPSWQRTHTSIGYLVMADSPEDAKQQLQDQLNKQQKAVELIGDAQEWGNFYPVHYGSCSTAEVARLKGVKPVEKPKKEPKLSDKPLGETQKSVLRSLQEHGKWPGRWVWDSNSGTERVLESLRLRCLVDLNDGVYTVNEEGLKFLNMLGYE